MRETFVSGQDGVPQIQAKEFASQWAEYCGVKHCLLLPHGTDALRIALASVFDHDGLSHGGEIIVPNFSFIASVTSALDRRFSVALADVDEHTLNLDPKAVEAAIIPGRTVGIMPVHLFGQPCDMSEILGLARRHGLKVIEDSAQSHGAVHALGRTGSLGDAAAFSFQSYKNLSSGEGGALTTNDKEVFERAYMLQDAGRSLHEHERWGHLALGWNCRPSEYVAAVLNAKLPDFEERQERRIRNFTLLHRLLSEVACIRPLQIAKDTLRHGAHMFTFRYLPMHCGGVALDEWLELMGKEGAPVWRGYSCTMSDQPALKSVATRHPDYLRKLHTPVADQAVQEVAYIPQNVFLGTESDMHELAAIFRKVSNAFPAV